MTKFNIQHSYPRNPDYDYEARLKRVNWDKRKVETIANDKGFFIQSEDTRVKYHINEKYGIFSNKYGRTLDDVSPFITRYSCECGHLISADYSGMTCPICKTKVKFIDDDFEYTGWLCLKDPYYIIHPNLFKSLSSLIGAEDFLNIIRYEDERDINGHIVNVKEQPKKTKKEEPFKFIGIMEFKERFDEICNYYLKKKPNKLDVYNDIMENRDKVFTQSIPVYSALLRPVQPDGTKLFFEDTSAKYLMMVKYVNLINIDELSIYRKKKSKNQLLFRLNMKLMDLYKELEAIMSGKKGNFRNLFAGRWAYTSRCVISPNPALKIDEITLPYQALVVLLQQKIINILTKTYSISNGDAYNIWFRAQSKQDPRVKRIIQELIELGEYITLPNGERVWRRGIMNLINRNPTITRGGILQMFCVGINDSFVMEMPLQILILLAADFDGDVLNDVFVITQNFKNAAYNILNPGNCFYISNNNGELNADVLYTKDTIINLNALLFMGRNKYSEAQLEKIKRIKETTDCI